MGHLEQFYELCEDGLEDDEGGSWIIPGGFEVPMQALDVPETQEK